MGGYIINTDKVPGEFQPLSSSIDYPLNYAVTWAHRYCKQVKDKHGAYLEVSRLEIFFHELSMYEEKIFLKRYELEQVRWHSSQ